MGEEKVQNFTLKTSIDGKKETLSAPRAMAGGFEQVISMRYGEATVEMCRIVGRADKTGRLALFIEPTEAGRRYLIIGRGASIWEGKR